MNQENLQNIDEIVFRFQEGDDYSGEEILRRYGCHPNDKKMTSYVGKYYKMLRFGKIDFKNRDSRRFIASFTADDELRNKLIPFYQYAGTKKESRRILQKVMDDLAVIEDEDLKQELRIMLLNQAMKYKKTKKDVDFTGYLYNSYFWAVNRYVKKLRNMQKRDMYLALWDSRIHLQDDRYADEDANIEIGEDIFVQAPMIQVDLDDELGNSWVRGLTCRQEFKDITPLQRLILKLHYHEGYTDGDIAEHMGIHINTIFRQRKKAKEIIVEAVARLIEEGHYQ